MIFTTFFTAFTTPEAWHAPEMAVCALEEGWKN
jgi:hypothetical protein